MYTILYRSDDGQCILEAQSTDTNHIQLRHMLGDTVTQIELSCWDIKQLNKMAKAIVAEVLIKREKERNKT